MEVNRQQQIIENLEKDKEEIYTFKNYFPLKKVGKKIGLYPLFLSPFKFHLKIVFAMIRINEILVPVIH